MNLSEFIIFLKNKDNPLVISMIPGLISEDGSLIKILENNKIPFIGSNSLTMKTTWDKYLFNLEYEELIFSIINSFSPLKGEISSKIYCSLGNYHDN